MVLLVSVVYSRLTLSAGHGNRYQSAIHGFSISFPEDWRFFERNGAKPVVGATNRLGAGIFVTIDPLSEKHRGRYKDISEIPGYLEFNKSIITKGLRGYIIDNGTIDISNTRGTWIKFALIRKTSTPHKYIIIYQIQTLKNDLIYTTTARVAGSDRNGALKRFAKLWPTLKKSLLSFRLGERLNPAKID